jgi:hypothetical protein
MDKNELITDSPVLSAHEYLIAFLNKFESAKRGGIHDFIEISIFNMINLTVKNIDDYLKSGHASVDATQIMNIVTDSYQKVLDGMKRNLESMSTVNFR